jgi:hypothetical protein
MLTAHGIEVPGVSTTEEVTTALVELEPPVGRSDGNQLDHLDVLLDELKGWSVALGRRVRATQTGEGWRLTLAVEAEGDCGARQVRKVGLH